MAIIRALGYTGNLQRLTIPDSFGADVVVNLWGGGGGGSGGDSNGARRGGNGGGGGYSQIILSVSPGDVLEIAVGQGGGVGGGATQGGPGSPPGQSYTINNGPPVYGGVANVAPIPTHPYGIGIPSGTGFYTRTQANNSSPTSPAILEWWVVINGVAVYNGTSAPPSALYTPGTYRGSTTAYDYGYTEHRSPDQRFFPSYSDQINAFDLTYQPTISYCGGHGGKSRVPFYSGAGGGGGGASVVLLNGAVVAYAAGGGGGGGCGNTQGAGSDAPGPNGQSGSSTAGSDGQTYGVGGGGGGGAGGNGGAGEVAEGLAQAGAYGRNLGDVTQLPVATAPGGITSPYYAGRAGYGGAGQNTSNGGGQPGASGYAVVELVPNTLQIKDSGAWKPVSRSYIKHNNAWQRIRNVYVKKNNVWAPVVGTSDQYAPNFETVPGYFGAVPRGYGAP